MRIVRETVQQDDRYAGGGPYVVVSDLEQAGAHGPDRGGRGCLGANAAERREGRGTRGGVEEASAIHIVSPSAVTAPA